MSTFEQRTIESFFQEYGVESADVKARLLPILTPVIYAYNQNVIDFEKETDEYRKNQVQRGIEEMAAKIKYVITSEGN
ncbi:MAG: hypothetical protein KIH65_002360 [Candidatus Uhrbacteria bacterium]|nr:hypothetical protein [Candidatus Uhrbacteria bacterium]